MTDAQLPGETVHGWRTPHEDECTNIDTDVYVKDPTHIVDIVTGYFNGDLAFYSFEPAEVTVEKVVRARIWTDDYAVRHHSYAPVRTVLSDEELDILTCLADVARTISASQAAAVRY